MTLKAATTAGLTAVLSLAFGTAVAAPAHAGAPRPPMVTSVSATGSSPAGGERVTVTGHRFTDVKRVLFGSKRATHVSRESSRRLRVTVPAHHTGTVRVRVVTDAGKSPKSALFVYTPPPVITSIKPDVGEPAGNVHIELLGKHFRTVSAATIGDAKVTPSIVSDTKLLLTVPPMAAGTYDVVVTNLAGSSVLNQHTRYIYAPSAPWHLVDPVPGTSEGNTEFVAADCESGTCYAVGDKTEDRSARDNVPLIDTEQDDGTWALAAVTPPGDTGAFKDAALRQVACSTADTCVAYGSDTDWSGTDPVTRPLVAIGSGLNWTTAHPPMPSDWHATRVQPFTAGACHQARCAVVGWFEVGSSKQLVVDTYADGTWTARSPARINGGARNIYDNLAVTCRSSTHCLAVGRDGRREPIAVDIPLTGKRRATVQRLPVRLNDSHHNITMTGIACSSSSSCVAVGYEFDAARDPDSDNGPPYAFFERYHDGRWSFHHFALPASIASHHPSQVRWDYPSVSCVSGAACYAVGGLDAQWKSSRGRQSKDAATETRITGTGQQSSFAPVLDRYAGQSALGAVFCGVQPRCVALGYQGTPPQDGDGPPTDVREFSVRIGTNDRPRIYQPPSFDGHVSDPSADACASPTHCIAVGSHDVPDGSGTRSVAWIQRS